MPCFTCGKACERDLFVSSIPWLSTKTIVVSSNNIHTVTLFQAIFSIDSLFDNVRHIFKTLNDVTPLWKRSKDANAPASQLKPSDSPPPHPPAGMTGAFTFYASKSRWILCSPGANWMESLWSSLQDEVYFMGGGAAGGLWRNQQWTPSWPPCWILPRIRNQVKCAINGDFFGLTWKITHK